MVKRMRVVDGPCRGEVVEVEVGARVVLVGGVSYRVRKRRRGARRIFELTISRP